jgi:hypothetical protein
MQPCHSLNCLPLRVCLGTLPPQSDKASSTLLELLVALLKEGLLSQAEVVEGLKGSTSTLGDLA